MTPDSDRTIDLNELNDQAFSELAIQVEQKLLLDRQTRNNLRHEKEKQQLQKDLDAANYSTQKTRVAFLLNLYPETRDSDITLTLRYWQIFQPDLYQPGNLPPYLLFKLERQTTISRLRAKIQNDYGLFRGSEEVQRRRRQLEESFRDDMVSDKPSSRMVQVFVDETGKTADYVIVGSIWFLDPARAAFFQNDVTQLTHSKEIRGEFHFAECKKQHLESYKLFVDLASEYRAYLSFKAIVAKRAGTSRKPDDAVKELLRLLLVKGFDEEVATARISPPRVLNVTLDYGSGMDSIDRENLASLVRQTICERHGDGSGIERISETESKISASIQLADLFSGALNRRLNVEQDSRNHKDDLADYLIAKLAPQVNVLDDGDSVSIIELQ